MTAEKLNKPASELTTAELAEILAAKKQVEDQERQEKRRDYEALRDSTVSTMVQKAANLNVMLKSFKDEVWGDLETLYKLLQEHSSRHADGKGSFTLQTTEGDMRVSFKRQDNTKFDERATQAEKHILDFIADQFGDTAPTSKLIRKLLERKKGQLEKDEVLKLISMKDDFDNDNWRKGIELLQESIVPGETRYYAKFEIKNSDGDAWKQISLDFARL